MSLSCPLAKKQQPSTKANNLPSRWLLTRFAAPHVFTGPIFLWMRIKFHLKAVVYLCGRRAAIAPGGFVCTVVHRAYGWVRLLVTTLPGSLHCEGEPAGGSVITVPVWCSTYCDEGTWHHQGLTIEFWWTITNSFTLVISQMLNNQFNLPNLSLKTY